MKNSTLARDHDFAPIARPLPELVPLIQDDLEQGRAAAERAALPYYRAAGEKLLEAKSQLEHGEFLPWVKRHFKVSPRMVRQYMNLAKETASEKGSALPFSSLSDFVRKTSDPDYNRRPPSSGPRSARRVTAEEVWEAEELAEEAEEWAEQVRREADRFFQTAKLQAVERDAQRKLALRVIDVGYETVALELHPDKGGSPEAMARLNAVRARLKQCV